jgi:hypothetical protein
LGPTTTASISSTNPALGRAGHRTANSQRPRTIIRPHSFAWLDFLIAMCAAGGLTASTLYGVQIRTSTFAASDFKTLYASVWCFAHHVDAYNIANLQSVFVANNVVQPEKWFGHAPVYPPTTLALLSPIAAMGMVTAAYVLMILSGVLLAVAVAALMRYAAVNFNMGPVWRMAIAGLCVGGPLLSFGLAMGNVSLAVAALCFLAFVWRKSGPPWSRSGSPWISSVALALALLLKPHLGLWTGLGMFLLPERAARAVVVRAIALAAGFATASMAAMAAMGTLGLEIHSYLGILSAETSAGASMSVASHEVLPIVAQITSLESIVGFWIASPMIRVALTGLLLLGLGFLLLRQTKLVDTERGALLAIGAWCTLGMIATYHRAHDAALVVVLVPWVVDRVRRTPFAWHAWVATMLYCAMSASADFEVVKRWVSNASEHSLTAFILLRQAGLADLLLLCVLLLAMGRERTRVWAHGTASAEADDLAIAA